jgi:hypothetical protein
MVCKRVTMALAKSGAIGEEFSRIKLGIRRQNVWGEVSNFEQTDRPLDD